MNQPIDCQSCKLSQEELSYGDWITEAESVDFLKSILKESHLFTLYHEVEGEILQPRMDCEDKGVRIDMILSPTQKLLQAGWRFGPIGIECKKSGVKLNEPFLQVDDYTRSVWTLKSGFKMMCQHYFIWPYRKTHGFAASLMAQKRIGTAEHKENHFVGVELRLFCGEKKALVWARKTDETTFGDLNCGSKVGSR